MWSNRFSRKEYGHKLPGQTSILVTKLGVVTAIALIETGVKWSQDGLMVLTYLGNVSPPRTIRFSHDSSRKFSRCECEIAVYLHSTWFWKRVLKLPWPVSPLNRLSSRDEKFQNLVCCSSIPTTHPLAWRNSNSDVACMKPHYSLEVKQQGFWDSPLACR